MSAASRRVHVLLGLAIGAWFSPLAAQTMPTAAHVIHISVDGLSAVYLGQELAAAPAQCPNFSRLIREGATTLNARCDYDFSETLPDHTCMWLGRPVLQPAGWPDTANHGITFNLWDTNQTFHNSGNSNVAYFSSVFDVVHDRGRSTAFFAGKAKLGICPFSYDADHGAPDLVGIDNGRNKVDYAQIVDWGVYTGWDLLQAVTNYLSTQAPDYLFLHIADLDYAGHNYGWGSAEWNAVLVQIDAMLGSLWSAVDRSADLHGRTAILLTADHGGGYTEFTHVYPEHPLNYTIPFMVWGPGWPAGADVYDLMVNRFDPGGGRPDYTAPQQPLRNGDSGNFALAILGLPAIPGSSLVPVYGPKATLHIAFIADGVAISWPSSAIGYVLEQADGFDVPSTWQPISQGISDDGHVKTYTVFGLGAPKYYRLAKPLLP